MIEKLPISIQWHFHYKRGVRKENKLEGQQLTRDGKYCKLILVVCNAKTWLCLSTTREKFNLHLLAWSWRTFDFTNNDKHNHLFWKYYKVGHLVAALGLLWLFHSLLHYVQIGIWQNFQIRWWKATLIPRPNVSPCSSVVYNISIPSFSLLFFWLIIHFSVLWEKSSTLGVLICRCCYFIFQSVLIIWIRGCEKIHS